MILPLLLIGCADSVAVDDSAKGEFIIGGVISTQVVDPYSYASRCPATGLVEIVLRTAANEEMIVSMPPLEPDALTAQTWFADSGFDFSYVADPINPGDWLEAAEGKLLLDLFEIPGGRVAGLVDIWGSLTSVEGELIDPDYHIRGSFDVPRTDLCE
ncbi:MAG: hypothetical protein P8R54_33710 [Myxococcota bacterium]|nr:hypothetical protein [Myxococcota bacterium]